MAKRSRKQSVEVKGVDHLAKFAIRWIKIVALLLGATVTFLEFRNAPLESFTRSFDNSSLMKIGLVIFFFGWLWGATNDTEIQRAGYCRDPKEGEVGFKEIAGIIVFLIVFGALFALHDRLVWFQLALLVFILVNSWTWWVIFTRTLPIIDASYEDLAKEGESRDNCSLAKLLVVVQYMNGPWQRNRFITLIVLAALQLAIAFLVSRNALAPYVSGMSLNGVPADVLVGYLPGTLFVLYVLISEIWMKIYRIKVFSDIATIDYLEAHFTVSKRRDAPLPAPHKARFLDFSPTANENYVGHGPVRWVLDML